MPCIHRFHRILLPPEGMKFLFIGTFNPIWNVSKGDNPDYFYSRDKSLFWCILPHAFNENCLIDKSKQEKEEFCLKNKIGLTDLIYEVRNVELENKDHKRFLTKGFKDEDFELASNTGLNLDLNFFTPQIVEYINQNHKSLRGIFLTRKTRRGIPRIWNQWEKIKKACEQVDLYCAELASPSVRGGGIRSKIFAWREAIESTKPKRP